MKKLVIVAMTAGAALALSACGAKDAAAPADDTTAEAPADPATSAAADEAAAAAAAAQVDPNGTRSARPHQPIPMQWLPKRPQPNRAAHRQRPGARAGPLLPG